MAQRLKNNQNGFSLIEVMIALAIFAVYVVAIISTQSSNINSSSLMRTDLTLHNLAQYVLDETLIKDNRFTNATESQPDTGNIDIEGFKEYKYKIEFLKNEFPDFAQIMGQTPEEEARDQSSGMKKKIFNILKKNIEKIIWQVSVTVTDPSGDNSYVLNTWITNRNAKINMSLGQ